VLILEIAAGIVLGYVIIKHPWRLFDLLVSPLVIPLGLLLWLGMEVVPKLSSRSWWRWFLALKEPTTEERQLPQSIDRTPFWPWQRLRGWR
jgi:hypothetical protein